jgi:hypothetical protein
MRARARQAGPAAHFSDAWHELNAVNYACFLVVMAMRLAMIGRMEALAGSLSERGRYINLVS